MKKLHKDTKKQYYILKPDIKIKNIHQAIFEPTIVTETNNNSFYSSCINCKFPPCIYFQEDELVPNQNSIFSEFPLI